MATIYCWDGTKWKGVWRGGSMARLAADWDDTHRPSLAGVVDEGFPVVTWTDLRTDIAATDLQARIDATISGVAGNGPVYVRLPEGVHRLVAFKPIGSSGDPLYAFGLWNGRLRGLKPAGDPASTVIQMDNGVTVSGNWVHAVSDAQLAAMATLDPQTFAPLQMGVARFDATPTEPFLLGGVTFQAVDQRPITTVHANLAAQGIATPQPAPHQGIVFHPGSSSARPHAIINNVRFIGVSRALNSAPPFECGLVNTQYITAIFRRCEFDGRRAKTLDPAQPRRSAPYLGNNDISLIFEDCWFHHSAVNRIALNDENKNTTALSTVYRFLRCKIEHMGDTNNVDPALNGGASLGGTDPAYQSPVGFESTNALIELVDSIIVQDCVASRAAISITTVGSRNPAGGKLVIRGCTFRYPHRATLAGFATVMIGTSTPWWTQGSPYGIEVWRGATSLACVTATAWPPPATNNPLTQFYARRF